MSKYRNDLPQLKGGTFLTDGGMETTLIFHEGVELPHFASFVLLADAGGTAASSRITIARYLDIAQRHGTGFVLDTATWRANADWGDKLGYSAEALKAANEDAVELLARASRRIRTTRRADRHQRRDRPARRRLQGRQDGCRRGRGLSRDADRDLRRHGGGHGDGPHADQHRRGDRHRARRQGARACPARSPSRWRPTAGS